jgi:hypothetical protein
MIGVIERDVLIDKGCLPQYSYFIGKILEHIIIINQRDIDYYPEEILEQKHVEQLPFKIHMY